MRRLDDERVKKIYERVVDCLQYDDDATFHPDYSGRFMYGNTTYGISGRFPEEKMFRYFLEAAADEMDEEVGVNTRVSYMEAIDDILEIVDDIYPKKQDQLGLGMIYYR